MPEFDVATQSTNTLNQAIAEVLCQYQQLVKRADRLTQKILTAQHRVDQLKSLSQQIEQFKQNPQQPLEHWLLSVLHQAELRTQSVAEEVCHRAIDQAFEQDKASLFDSKVDHVDTLEQLKRQYQQHRDSCDLMQAYCKQSYEFLQLLRFQAEQLQDLSEALLASLVIDPDRRERWMADYLAMI